MRADARRQDDEGVAILFVLLCVLVSTGLSIGLLGVLLGELAPTVYERKSARTIAASQAGLQAGLAAVRAATSGTTTTSSGATVQVGDRSRLPCQEIVGTPGGTPGGLGYRVRIRYYTADPTGQSEVWRNASVNRVPCTTATGTGTGTTPLYALIQAGATGDSAGASMGATWGDRSSEVVYTLRRTDQAYLGGLIHTSPYVTTTDLCWQAPSATPSPGATLTLATCVSTEPRQRFSYRKDYTIVLSSTQNSTVDPPTGGMCVHGNSTTTSGNNGNGNGNQQTVWTLTLQVCGSPVPWQQKWSFNDWSNFEGVRADNSSLSGMCIRTGDVYTVGRTLGIEPCPPSGYWGPEPTVGAGAAGTSTSPNQLINYAEYGRCLDVTNFDVNWNWLINFPCKQDPTRPVGWNQRFVYLASPGSRQLRTDTANNGAQCLTTASSAGGRVLVRPCDTNRADQRWTKNGDTGDRTSSYTVVDASGRCLSLAPPPPEARDGLQQFSHITADPCDGSNRQKWNAPPFTPEASLGGERETTKG